MTPTKIYKPEQLARLQAHGFKQGHLRFGDTAWYKECFFRSLTPGKVYYIVVDEYGYKGYSVFQAKKTEFSPLREDLEPLKEVGLIDTSKRTADSVRESA